MTSADAGGGNKDQSFPFSPTLPPAPLTPGKSGRSVFHPHASMFDANASSPEDDGPHGRSKDDGDFISACQQSKKSKSNCDYAYLHFTRTK